jgi:arylsulfatase A-like enzyme
MIKFRDKRAKEVGMELIVYSNPKGDEMNISPFTHGSALHTDIMKTEGFKQMLDIYKFDAVFGGARRDEEKSRAKERIYSFRDKNHRWDPKNQRPELWNIYNGKLRGLKRQCYEGGIRIPFIVRWPGKVKAGTVNDHQLAFYDIMPTFCELIGDKKFPKKYINKNLEGDCFDGISFAPTLFGDDENQKKHDYLYWEFHETDQLAVRMGDWKLVVKKGIPHLYNLADDIHEDNDISTNHPEIVKQMIEIIKKEHKESDIFKITLPL